MSRSPLEDRECRTISVAIEEELLTPKLCYKHYVSNSPLRLVDRRGLVQCLPSFVGAPACNYPGTDGGAGDGGMFGYPDLSSADNCSCGYTIFDAIRGAPGTYVQFGMHGQLGFGFSSDLWSTTQNFLDANPYLAGSSALQVVVENFGVDQVTSGLVPEYVAVIQERARTVGAMPGPFAQDLAVQYDEDISSGMGPRVHHLVHSDTKSA